MKHITAIFAIIIVFLAVTTIDSAINDNLVAGNKYLDMVNSSVTIRAGGQDYGAGVFIDDNVVLTASHVLEHSSLTIELTDGTALEVDDFYIDESADVGFIFVDANEICIAKISSASEQIGDTVYLVGSPFNLAFTLSKGIISHIDRDVSPWEDLFQTDAEGGPGSSGGPLYNSDGSVIGICVGGVPGAATLCVSAETILEAYERCKNAADQQRLENTCQDD